MKIYISGGITGIENARQRFATAQEQLILKGFTDVVNPFDVNPSDADCDGSCKLTSRIAKNGVTSPHSYECNIKHDLKTLLECDAVCMLPGYSESQGAQMEHDVAVISGLDVRMYGEWMAYNDSEQPLRLGDDDDSASHDAEAAEVRRPQGSDAQEVPGHHSVRAATTSDATGG